MGVVLLPFIDRHRLVRAMHKADRNGAVLSPQEREMNRRGEVLVFLGAKHDSGITQALSQIGKRLEGSVSVELFASFQRQDQISGTVRVNREAFTIGGPVKVPYKKLNLEDVASNQVYRLSFEHASYDLHITKLLD